MNPGKRSIISAFLLTLAITQVNKSLSAKHITASCVNMHASAQEGASDRAAKEC